MTDIELPKAPEIPLTLLSVQLDSEAEVLLKEANEIEAQFLDQLFPQEN